ncbi:MAG: biopolymer transporter ExbD [Kiritimatiellia bacterium]|jgi:biopolymer transport protein ExbD|nr:biopolymer transporter ExbD [Kiritimatiellia bacterium]MDP6809560.1 biopolymer transporter ExbD [Kiritimatiellia bacterium]MDP7023589.1 biopolymer transporter ExbD [Kiritimatiellia bacterium]
MRKRKRRETDAAQLEMTPMIDVVFQLLIFFIVTLKQEDILSHLDVSRPSPDPDTPVEQDFKDLLTITVHRYGYMLKGKVRTVNQLERDLTRLAGFSKDLSVIIRCTGDSQHERLVKVLNICAKVGLKKLSVFSM